MYFHFILLKCQKSPCVDHFLSGAVGNTLLTLLSLQSTKKKLSKDIFKCAGEFLIPIDH